MIDPEENERLQQKGEETEENDNEVPEVPPPPDGGYGWIIVFASFMCNLIVDGIAYTFGIFLGEFASYFGEGKGKVAWVGSLLSGMYLCAGPIVSALTNKFGCRAVCIAGAIVAATAFVLSTFSKSLTMLMLTYGVLGGFGFGMIYLPAVVVVGYYFETKRSLATGLAVCGSGVGTFSFAPLAAYLLDKFDWKNANFMLAGIILNCAVFGALMQPLEYPPKDASKKSLMQRMYEQKKAQLERGSIAGSFFVVQHPDGTMERKLKIPVNADPGVHSSLALDMMMQQQNALQPVPTLPTISETTQDHANRTTSTSTSKRAYLRNRLSESETSDLNPHRIARNSSQPSFSTGMPNTERVRKISGSGMRPSFSKIRTNSKNDINEQCSSKYSIAVPERLNTMVRPFSRKDIFYSGTVTNLKEYQSQKSLRDYRISVLSFSQYEKEKCSENVQPSQTEATGCNCLGSFIPNSFYVALATMMDFKLFRNPAFLCIGVSNFFGMAGLYVPFVYIVDAAIKAGIETNSASMLLSTIGISNTIGRVLCGYVADFPQVNSLFLNNMCLLLATVTVALVPFCTLFSSYMVVAIFFGFAIAGYMSLTSIILVDLLGLDKLTNAFGLLILCRGAAATIGSPLAGILYDLTLSYDIPFFTAGAFFGISAMTSFLAPFTRKFVDPDTIQSQVEALPPIDEDPLEDEDDDEPITLKPKLYTTPNMLALREMNETRDYIDQ